MQIKELDKSALPQAAEILKACTNNARSELSGYFVNDAAAVYGAFEDGVPCGVAVIIYTPDFADVADIAVLKPLRGRGIGRAIIEYCTHECKSRGISSLLLEVRASNTSAISFYEKLGFEKISVRKKYYSAPEEDALIYRREL